MKYGIREICDVVFKAKSKMTIGNKIFYKDEPVIYFDTLKTSTMEGASSAVYAQGGRGNPRLIAWEGDRTVTFTMEDALISTLGLAILTGAGVVDATAKTPVIQHITERIELSTSRGTCVVDPATQKTEIILKHKPYVKADGENYIYVMQLDSEGNVNTEPYLYVPSSSDNNIKVKEDLYLHDDQLPKEDDVVLVDYYYERTSGAQQIEITADKFAGNFYVEASTLFRQTNGADMPAEFIIPNCKVQSNFTFSMAASGDPSTFTFTLDAFPDYTRFDRTKKVLSAIQLIEDLDGTGDGVRYATDANPIVVNGKLDPNGDPTEITSDGSKLYLDGKEIDEYPTV